MDQKVLHFTMKAALYSRIADSQEPHTKQANGFTDWMQGTARNVGNWYQELAPDKRMALMGGLIGGGGGAALGGLSAMARPKNKRHLLRDALIGGLSGGALGVGAGYLGQIGGYLGGAGQPPTPHSDLVNDPAMKALQGAPAAALAGMGGNPMAMMAASNAAMTPTTPSGNPTEQAYNQYLKGQSPEAAKGYFEYLGQGEDPEAFKRLTEQYVNEYGPSFSEQYPDLTRYLSFGGSGAVPGAGIGGYLARGRAMGEYRAHRENPLAGPMLKAYKEYRPDAFDKYKVGPKHPDYATTGEYNRGLAALEGMPGAPAVPRDIQERAMVDAIDNPNSENSVLKALTPDMETKIVKEPAPGEPARAPSNLVDAHGRPIRPGTPEGKARLIDKEVSSWTGRFNRPSPTSPYKGEKFLDNKLINEMRYNPEFKEPTRFNAEMRGLRGAAKGGIIGAGLGLGVPALYDAGKAYGPGVLQWIKNKFYAPSTAAAQQ